MNKIVVNYGNHGDARVKFYTDGTYVGEMDFEPSGMVLWNSDDQRVRSWDLDGYPTFDLIYVAAKQAWRLGFDTTNAVVECPNKPVFCCGRTNGSRFFDFDFERLRYSTSYRYMAAEVFTEMWKSGLLGF